MYINVAYVDEENPNLEDLTVPSRQKAWTVFVM